MRKSWRNVVIGDDSTPEMKNGSVSAASSVSSVSSAGSVSSATSGSVNFSSSSINRNETSKLTNLFGISTSTGTSTGTSINSNSQIHQKQPKPQLQQLQDQKRHERLFVVYAPLLNHRVTVFLYDGAVFEGTLDSFETETEFSLILRMATMLKPGREVIDSSVKAGITFELMNIRFDDMAELKAVNNSSSISGSTGGIGTDSAISKKKGDFGRERELHRWCPDSTPTNSFTTFTEESVNATPTANNKWDQFATNEKLFGLKTDFNEELYTTKLDRNSAHIRANEANAERIAKEIMTASTGGNVHLAEERGQRLEIGGDDEEMLYGAVIRESLPPGFVKNVNENVTSTSTSTNTSTSFNTNTSLSTLNPTAPEFKLNINAPEFNPSSSSSGKVTYYNQSRRNLNHASYTNYQPNYGYYPPTAYGYPNSVPYYYVPPFYNHNHNEHEFNTFDYSNPISNPNDNNNNIIENNTMNPNAVDFGMQYYDPVPHYYQDDDYYYNCNENENGNGDEYEY